MTTLPAIPLRNLSDRTLATMVDDLRHSARVCYHLSAGVPAEYAPALDRQGDQFAAQADAIEEFAKDAIIEEDARRARWAEIKARHGMS